MFVNEMSDWRTIHEQKKQKKRFDNEIQFGDLNYDEDEDDESETIIDNSTTQMNQDESLKNRVSLVQTNKPLNDMSQ